MSDLETDISFLIHDLKNSTGAAISHLRLLVMKNTDLEYDKNVTAIFETLDQSMQLSNDICQRLKHINF